MSNAGEEQLKADLMETKRALMAARAELLKSQLVSATRLDIIKLLGHLTNRQDIPDLSALLPESPEVRAVFARELRELARELRARAANYEAVALSLDGGEGA